jgi:hypothetical protein
LKNGQKRTGVCEAGTVWRKRLGCLSGGDQALGEIDEALSRRLYENDLFPRIFVKLEKIILGILTICLR